ncbi:MAG: DUF962 domain-containing protein [Hyphomicrobiales bacterium]|nr:DUF962 domain-containing protein [Hyphomicrobiales bacterium]MCP5374249.1 DUF962 domain-containing protein [Hyphomicrobiales bacterium]
MNQAFVEQMAMYSAYHRDWRNKATHFVGVPAIAFSLLVALGWIQLFDLDGLAITGGLVFAVVVMTSWVLLDRGVGLATTLAFLPLVLIADAVSTLDRTTGLTVFALFFVGGWVVQLLGHAFEGRKPALMDNLLQIFIAPTFLAAEVLFALGLCHPLRDAVEARWTAYAKDARRAPTAAE